MANQPWRPDWAKGLTAATDSRVAKMAASRRGHQSWARGRTAADHPGIARGAAKRRGKKRGPYRWHSDRGLMDRGLIRFGPEHLVGDLRPRYAYLFGLYLGDGTVYAFPSRVNARSARFDVYLDAQYPALVIDCLAAMAAIHPRGTASASTDGGCTTVSSWGRFWLALFPQHGPGRKHTRKIALEPWQNALVLEHPWEFFRGLMDSDGSRFDRVVNGKSYPAYEFANKSTDILRIFCDVADHLGVHYTVPDVDSISIATRASVALLDSILPPKTTAVPQDALLRVRRPTPS